MELTEKQTLDLCQYSFLRLDGAWFISLAMKYGIPVAWEMDVEAWKQMSLLFGKRVRKTLIPDPVWPASFIDVIHIFSEVFRIKGREVIVDGDRIIVRVTDCDTQKAIAKAGIAECGIVTRVTYEGIIRGLFDREMPVNIEHTKNLNKGAECCEVVVTMGPQPA